MTPAELKLLCGDAPEMLPGRGSCVIGRHKAVMITSQQSPHHWMRRNESTALQQEDLFALFRRCRSVWNCQRNLWYPEIVGEARRTETFSSLEEERAMTLPFPNPWGSSPLSPSSPAWIGLNRPVSSAVVVESPDIAIGLSSPTVSDSSICSDGVTSASSSLSLPASDRIRLMEWERSRIPVVESQDQSARSEFPLLNLTSSVTSGPTAMTKSNFRVISSVDESGAESDVLKVVLDDDELSQTF